MSNKYNFLIVASNFYPKITDGLIIGATSELKKLKCNYKIYNVKGSLEIPVKIAIALNKKKYDAVIALGCIIKGKTDHYEFIASAITNSLLSLSIDKKIPISNAVLTCSNLKQAKQRSSNKVNRAREAVLAAISVIEA
tara:strand:- start:366 stop:779 length:414 start_codon:yes stop_codon:yes gene_type:complete